ncbi:MAG: DUF6519 domain-containing protein [Rhizomicrobium sp.]
MKADFTRKTFLPAKNTSRVLMQQGRVQLDADWNEQAAIEFDHVRLLGADLMGSHGGPLLSGFLVSAISAAFNLATPDFAISSGRYYVDGIPCSNETAPSMVTGYPDDSSITVFPWTTDGVSYAKGQYIWLWCANLATGLTINLFQISAAVYGTSTLTLTGDPAALDALAAYQTNAHNTNGVPQYHFVRRAPTYLQQDNLPGAPALAVNTAYQIYLDVWERAITHVQDDTMREVALNGIDTAARARIVAQVKAAPLPAGAAAGCPTSWEIAAIFQPANRGCLAARAKPATGSTDPCTIAPDSLYRGPENQLYRIEVHTPSLDAGGKPQTPTFKWSRENGSVVFPIAGGGGTSLVTLESLGRDDRFTLVEGDWVEVVDDDYELQNRAAPLHQVQAIDRVRMTVTLTGQPDSTVGGDPAKHPMLRRWDQKQGDPAQSGLQLAKDGTVPVVFAAPPAAKSLPLSRANTAADYSGIPANAAVAPLQYSSWLELEDGVQVQFTVPPVFNFPGTTQPLMQFRTGDYWLIPARVATGDVEWPTELVANAAGQATKVAVPMQPDGVTHHYAPLAQIQVGAAGVEVLHTCAVQFGIVNGALAFFQDSKPYSANWLEATVVQPVQASHVEKLVRPAKPPKEPKK